jgi:hypothetical protein
MPAPLEEVGSSSSHPEFHRQKCLTDSACFCADPTPVAAVQLICAVRKQCFRTVTGIKMPSKGPQTIMGLAALQPVRSPAVARFLQLPIPCVYSTRNTAFVYLGQPLQPAHRKRRKLRTQALRLHWM